MLYTGNDFLIIDFEGEPARPLGERRIKRTPMRDVAGMLRSFDYAAYTAVRQEHERGLEQSAETRALAWGRFWYAWTSAAYLGSYMRTAREAGFLPAGHNDEIELLLDVHMLEKAVYELGYELNNRPDWLGVPSAGLLALLDGSVDA